VSCQHHAPAVLHSGEKTRYPLNGRLVGSNRRSSFVFWRREKYMTQRAFESRISIAWLLSISANQSTVSRGYHSFFVFGRSMVLLWTVGKCYLEKPYWVRGDNFGGGYCIDYPEGRAKVPTKYGLIFTRLHGLTPEKQTFKSLQGEFEYFIVCLRSFTFGSDSYWNLATTVLLRRRLIRRRIIRAANSAMK
jgi:hypothetical protein